MKPFKLTETSPGKFSLLLTEFSPASDVFEKACHEGGGYSWEAVARQVVEGHPGLAQRLSFDPESSMFCAYGTDKAALEQLGAELAVLFHDPAKLQAVIARVPEDAWDD